MSQAINEARDIISGDYGSLRITYRRLMFTWTVTVYCGPTRIDELCGTWDNPQAAWAEARRIARAAYEGVRTADIIAAKPSELALAEVKALLDTVPTGDHRQVRPTVAGAHLAPLADAQLRALRAASLDQHRRVYAGDFQRATLRALARKGYGTLNYQVGRGRRKVIDSLTLNGRGERAAAKCAVAA